MISKNHRFHGQAGLQSLFKRGQAFRTDLFVLRHLANRRESGFRLAIVVSKKVDKRAVIRNRIRRRLYELFRNRLSKAGFKADLAVIVLKNDLAETPFSELQKLFEPVFEGVLSRYDGNEF